MSGGSRSITASRLLPIIYWVSHKGPVAQINLGVPQ
jgi:hypothetical protein